LKETESEDQDDVTLFSVTDITNPIVVCGGVVCIFMFLSSWANHSSQNVSENRYLVDNFNEDLSSSWRGRYDDYNSIYTIESTDDNSYLSANSIQTDNFIIKAIDVDLVEYPYLNWRWRAHTLPVEGDESIKAKCDVAASIAVVLNKSRIIPKSIKYSWSTSLTQDSLTKSPFAFWPSRCDIRVMQSGSEESGIWVHEKVNVLEDYKLFYNKNRVKSKTANAIVILTDSDNTKSLSKADYDDIYFSKK